LFGEADMTEHHCHDVSMAKHSAGNEETGKNSADDQIIADLDTLKRTVESRIPNAIGAILTDQLTDYGSSTVAWRFHRMAMVLVSALFELAKAKPSLLRPIAETSEAWPSFISPHQDYVKTGRELIERIGVGKKHFLRLNFPEGKRGKQWSIRTRVNLIAVQLIKKLAVLQCVYRSEERDRRDKKLQQIYKEHRLKEPPAREPKHSRKLRTQIITLPPPSTETANQWFDAGWNFILEETNGRPEWNPILHPLGAFRKQYVKTSSPAARTSDSNVRDGIKQRLRAAFSDILAAKM
jgi:hypothetical protein